MPFTPTPLKTNPVELALSIREMRMKQQQAERDFQINKIKAIGDSQKNAIANREAEAKAAAAELDLMERLAQRREAAVPGFQADQASIVDKFRTDPSLQNVREGMDSETAFGSIVQENDPNFVARNIAEEVVEPVDEAARKRFGFVNASIERIARAQAAQPGAESVDVIRKRLHDALGIESATDDLKRDKAFEDRERDAKADDQRSVTRERRSVDDAIRVRDKALRAALNPNLSEAERAAALDELNIRQGFINRKVNEGVTICSTADKQFAFSAATTIQNAKSLSASMKAFIPEIEANAGAAGVQAAVSSFLGQSKEIIGDVRLWLEEQKAENPDNEELQAINIDDAELQSATDLSALGDLVALTIVRLNSPDRFAQSMFDRWAKRFDFSRKSSAQVVRSMKSAIAVLDSQASNAESRLSPVVNSVFLNPVERLQIQAITGSVPDDEGSFIESERVGFPSVDLLRQQRGALPFDPNSSVDPGMSASDFLQMSPEEKARILLGQ